MARTRTVRQGEFSFPARGTSRPFSVRFLEKHLSEKTLRRLIPYLLTTFFAVLLAGTLSQFIHGRQIAADEATARISLIAETIAARLRNVEAGDATSWQKQLAASLPAGATADGRRVFVSDAAGQIVASAPITTSVTSLQKILGEDQAVTTSVARASVMQLQLADGPDAFATVRDIADRQAQLTLIQPTAAALSGWHKGAAVDATLTLTAGFVLLLIGVGFRWLSDRTAMAETQLAAAQRDLTVTLRKTKLGLCDWNLSRGHVRLTRSLRKLLGLADDCEWMPYSAFAGLIHSDDDLYGQVNNAMQSDMDDFSGAFRFRHANGDTLNLNLHCAFVHDEATNDIHLVTVFIDRMQAADVNQVDAQLHDAVEAISEAFVLWDNQNRLVMCNSKYKHFYKLDDEAVVPGTPYERVIANATEPVVRTRTSMRGGTAAGAQKYEAQLEDGSWLHIDERRTKDGGFVSVGTDITSLKQSQQRRQKSEEELKATITDLRASRRELEQQKQQLVDLMEKYALEKNRAEAANQAKSEFLANISHELRTPLNAVIGFSEVMENGLFGPIGNKKYLEYARDIHESGKYLLEVINDVLDMSKIEAGRLSLEMEEMDAGGIIRDSVRVVAPAAGERSIVVKRAGLRKLPLHADKRALKQILLNLLSNAVKFTPEDGTVTVRLSKAKGCAKISIKDTGIGIPESELGKLGRPFEQVENQFTKSHRGSGLGLAISRSLVELHGGKFEITSKMGEGTVVTCHLPLHSEPTGETGNQPRAA